MFKDRNLLIATKHGKEKVITPLLENGLGIHAFINPNFDTDILGTFTGEVERKEDALQTARSKCLLASKMTDCDLVIASEGSFFPHPSVPFISLNVEILYFIDVKNGLEIYVHEQDSETNFGGSEIMTIDELHTFASRSKFPSHGLIMRKSKNESIEIVKGIISQEQLIHSFNFFLNKYGKAYIETDMRAMYNPTRMNVIEKAAKRLVDKIICICPKCHTPGFGITQNESGLPCSLCKFPTRSMMSMIYTCQKCSFTKKEDYPNGKFEEDPMYCDVCNP